MCCAQQSVVIILVPKFWDDHLVSVLSGPFSSAVWALVTIRNFVSFSAPKFLNEIFVLQFFETLIFFSVMPYVLIQVSMHILRFDACMYFNVNSCLHEV